LYHVGIVSYIHTRDMADYDRLCQVMTHYDRQTHYDTSHAHPPISHPFYTTLLCY